MFADEKLTSSCFYPTSDSSFDISTYLGVWYQVAGYVAIFDASCKCITANYSLNDNGTVHVVNQCQELGLPVTIAGTAAAADTAYGDVGVFDVTLAGFGSVCPGPNYIVQGESRRVYHLCLGVFGRRKKEQQKGGGEEIDTEWKNILIADLCASFLSIEYVEGDYAIVQSPDFSTLFVLSREQNVTTTKLTVSPSLLFVVATHSFQDAAA